VTWDWNTIKDKRGQWPIHSVRPRITEAERHELRDWIVATSGGRKGVSVRGGEHSPFGTDELADKPDVASRLECCAIDAARSCDRIYSPDFAAGHSWDIMTFHVVLQPGGWQEPHKHPGARWAAVYYVDGHVDAGGELYMEDGVGGLTRTVAPRLGVMRVMPASLVHGVRTYRGAVPRVAWVANIYRDPPKQIGMWAEHRLFPLSPRQN
jgi:hypothetical protein